MKRNRLVILLVFLGMVVLSVLVWRARYEAPTEPIVPSLMTSTGTESDANTQLVDSEHIATASKSKMPSHIPTISEKRQQRANKEADKAAEIRAKLLELSAKTGLTTNELWRQVESYYYPERVRLRSEAVINDQRERGLAAGGITAQLWRREAELEVLSSQLTKGMSLSAITNILGMPFRAQTRVVTNKVSRPYSVPLDQMEAPRLNLYLTYSPHPTGDDPKAQDEWRILTVFLDEKNQLSKWTYVPPSGTW